MIFYTDEQLSMILSAFEAINLECNTKDDNKWWKIYNQYNLWLDATVGSLGYKAYNSIHLLRLMEKIGLA